MSKIMDTFNVESAVKNLDILIFFKYLPLNPGIRAILIHSKYCIIRFSIILHLRVRLPSCVVTSIFFLLQSSMLQLFPPYSLHNPPNSFPLLLSSN